MTPPAWVLPYVEQVRCAFGLQAWSIKVMVVSRGDLAEEESDGQCTYDSRYLHATIKIRDGYLDDEPNESDRELLIHEVLHIALAGVSDAMEAACNLALPKRQKRRDILHAYSLAEEQALTRMGRGLRDVLLYAPLVEDPAETPAAESEVPSA